MTGPLAICDGDITFEGVRLRTRHLGPDRPGPRLVFLHEGLGSIGQWKAFPQALCAATGLPGFLYERQGFGGSDPIVPGPRPLDYLDHEATRVLPAVLDRLGIDQPVLVGHSDGATLALLFAAAFPTRAKAVVSIAAHVFVEEITLAGIDAAVRAWDHGDLRDRLSRHHGANTEGAFRGWAETWRLPAFRDWSMTASLPAIRCPLLAIQGEDDTYGSPRQVATIVALAGGPAKPLMMPGCGHMPHLQVPERTVEAAGRFIVESLEGAAPDVI
ncbi:alpha/beta hydrolase [Rhodospirillum rubrum]|uniref:alpha/beta fold hydrolase n=1 Tax=Rhodospirillum rubrum TaxID=1085 RepID=UPI001905F9D6|nr:alpha/beta hydrolase [Rhodospirillum rubrum]MBK1665999.1 alpha/beta hydrolase [Rhodospirillum rubrum]MBK1675875.1 alpha/beta hydrolase [Rhodospirillum rubrum]